MTEMHVQVDTLLLILAGGICSALMLTKVILLTYDDVRRTWKKIMGGSDRPGPD